MNYTLITGASSGIGKSLAYKFASQGHNLILVARRINILLEMKKEIEEKYGNKVEAIECDLSQGENAHALYQQVSDFEINTWINNAGFGNLNNLWDIDTAHMNSMIGLNIESLWILSTLYTKDYQDKDAQLINVSSVAGYETMPTAATYVGTKFFVSGFTESLASELKLSGKKMKAKILAPGPVATEFINVANVTAKNKFNDSDYDGFKFMTSEQMAEHAFQLYESDEMVGIVDAKDLSFKTSGPIFPMFNLGDLSH